MAGSFSDYLEAKLLDEVFGGVGFTPPATVYAAAMTANPTDAGGGTEVPSSNNYSRVAITNDATSFPAASGGAKANGIAITFPQASGSWGNIVGIALYDASTAGNLLAWGDFASTTIGAGDTLNVPAGDLDITLT